MKHMAIWAVVMGSLFLGGCSSSDSKAPGEGKPLRLEGVVEGCKDVQSICTASEPPICHDYCADEGPGTGGGDCEPLSGAYETCGGTPCAVGIDDSGQEFEVCYPPDCVISYDVETKTETISCPPGTSPGGPGGSEPGDPGSGGGSEPGSPGDSGGEPKGL